MSPPSKSPMRIVLRASITEMGVRNGLRAKCVHAHSYATKTIGNVGPWHVARSPEAELFSGRSALSSGGQRGLEHQRVAHSYSPRRAVARACSRSGSGK